MGQYQEPTPLQTGIQTTGKLMAAVKSFQIEISKLKTPPPKQKEASVAASLFRLLDSPTL
jgi:hypothetical protein